MRKQDSMIKKEIADVLKSAQKIAITSHVRPDADCIGSALALEAMLRQIGKDVCIRNTDPAPYPLTRLPGFETIRYAQIYPDAFDLVVLVEGGTEERTGQKHLERYQTVNIDHHATGAQDGTWNWVDPGAAAVGEMVYELGHWLGITFTPMICTNLYAAIASDTGSFRYSNTTAKSLRIASELARRGGVRPHEVSDLLFNNNPVEKIRMLQRVLGTLDLGLNGRVAIINFRRSFLDNLQLREVETEDIVALARSIRGVDVTLFFKEIGEESYRVSIRSKGAFNSQWVAGPYGGGGHEHAAGFFCNGSLDALKEEILQLIDSGLRRSGGEQS